jgi:hypothetical protein
MQKMWRLSEAGPRNLGLACTDDGLLIGHTSLIERHDGRFVVRSRGDIERLLKCAYDGEPPLGRLMSGLARVASALNANDQCLARIAAVHLQIPDLASPAVRDALAAEDVLIKYARDEGTGAANWNPALHPRTGAPPNPGWFAPTGGASHDTPGVRLAGANNPTRQSDEPSGGVDNWVRLPPAKRIDELGDFLEWLANAKPEDEQTIRAEINRYWVGDVHALSTLHSMLSEVLKPGTTREDRQHILELIDHYSHHDPAEASHFYAQLFDLLALLGAGLRPEPQAKVPGAGKPAPAEEKPPLEGSASPAAQSLAETDAAAWKLGWADRGWYFDVRLGRTLHKNFPVIDKIPNGIATSIKSIDLRAASYQNVTTLTRRLSEYAGEVSEFAGGELGEDVVRPSEIKGRALSLAVPKGSMTETQKAVIEEVRRWARTLKNPVDIIINEF